jgi:opacity protein-like surface antigen
MRLTRTWLIALTVLALGSHAMLAAAEMGRVEARHANLRKAPSAESGVLVVLERGTEVEILARTGSWLKVRVPVTGAEGFLHESVAQTAPRESRGTPSQAATESTPTRPTQAPRVVTSGAAPRETRSVPAAREDAARLRVRAFGHASYVSFSAKRSFETILGGSSGTMIGGGVQLRYRAAFLQVGLSHFSKSGERVFELDGQAYPLGVKDSVIVSPVTAIGGVRLLRRGPIELYVGAGVGLYSYKEKSDFEDKSEGVDKSFTSFHAIAGAEYRVARLIGVGLEGHYTSVPNAIGQGGVSAIYGETNLGGVGVQLKVLVGK